MKVLDPDAFTEALIALPPERLAAMSRIVAGTDRKASLLRMANELDATHPEIAATMREMVAGLHDEPTGAFAAEFMVFARSSGDVVGEEARRDRVAASLLRFLASRSEVDAMVRARGGDLAAALEIGADELDERGGAGAAEEAGLMRMAAREARRTGATLEGLRAPRAPAAPHVVD